MRTLQCPICLAYTQGDFATFAVVPIHFPANKPDTEMVLAESLNQDEKVCSASEHLVLTTKV